MMGKSASGKDAIYKRLLEREELNLVRVISYTTRPIRKKETPGVEYNFCTEDEERSYEKQGRIIERREYMTRLGRWAYFLVDDGQIDLSSDKRYIIIGTLDSYKNLKNFYGDENVIPIYIEADDYVRLLRAIRREHKQQEPKYEEVCRRFLADCEDFSEDNLIDAGLKPDNIFENHDEIEEAVSKVASYIVQAGR